MEIQEVLRQIDTHTEEVQAIFGPVTSLERGWRQDPTKWSINQHLEHVIVLNESYYPEFERVHKNEKNKILSSRIPGLPTLLGGLILKASRPQNPRKMKTFSVWQPSISQSNNDVVLDFENHHRELKSKIMTLEAHLGKRVIVSSPANKWVVYPLETAFEILLAHEQRHIQHAKKILELVSGSTSKT